MANTALTGIIAGAASQAELEAGTSTTVYTSPGRQHLHPSAAKAWVNFNGTGTVAIRSSYNVTSITDNNTGDYTINFTTAFSSASAYTVVGLGSLNRRVQLQSATFTSAQTASSVRILSTDSGTTATDDQFVGIVAYGDQ